MKKRAAVAPSQERQKVQLVSCPCCEARLALHFVHGENEVYDVELVATDSGNQSRCLPNLTFDTNVDVVSIGSN